MKVDEGGARSQRTLKTLTGGLDLICCSSFLTRSYSTERFMLCIDHFGISVKDRLREGNSGGIQMKMVAVGLEKRGLI